MWKGLFGGAHFPVVGPWLLQHDVFHIRLPGEQQIPQGGLLCSPGNGVAAVDKSWLSNGCKDGISPDSLFGRAASRTVRGGIFGVNEVFLLPVEIGKRAVSLNKE